jgi:DNA processing protein
MTIFGVTESELATLVRPLSREGAVPDRAALADRVARAAWSGIAEPGDGDAGLLVETLGAETSVIAIAAEAGKEVATLQRALAEVGADSFSRQQLVAAVERWRPRISIPSLLLSLRQASRFGASLLVPSDPDWPLHLSDLGPSTPLAMWARGDRGMLGRLERAVAIVGARAATSYGEHVTVESSAGLVDRGFTIVSGAAYGIDGIAHRAALASSGETVAFLAGGVDRFYPAGHEALLTRIVERGVVVSEVPCGTAPTRWRFLQRNRLIAAASQAVVVVEAGWRSGSLNTAHHAAQLGRPIGAVPGPVTSAASGGCHRLLRSGIARCVTTPDEMAELVNDSVLFPGDVESSIDSSRGAAPTGPAPAPRFDPDGTRTRLLDALSERSGRDVHRIAAQSGLAEDRVRAELGLLELEGLVHERPSGWLKRSGNGKDRQRPR